MLGQWGGCDSAVTNFSHCPITHCVFDIFEATTLEEDVLDETHGEREEDLVCLGFSWVLFVFCWILEV